MDQPLDLHISLEGRRNVSGQMYRQLRAAILDGRLRPHEALPSSRDLARRLEVSQNTVLLVYARLRAEGFLRSRAGAGTFVRDGIRHRSQTEPTRSPLRPRSLWDDIPEGLDMSVPQPDFDFRPGIPDDTPAVLPTIRAHDRAPASLGYGAIASDTIEEGLRRLRSCLSEPGNPAVAQPTDRPR